jgi:hypothetical protein
VKGAKAYVDKVKAYPFPKGKDWEAARQEALDDFALTEHIEISMLDFFEKNDTARLTKDFNGKPLPADCLKKGELLKTDAGMRKVFEEAVVESCKTNGSPASCRARAEETKKDKKSLRAEAFAFGWNNCVIGAFRKVGSTEDPYEKAIAALEKSLLNKKCECDEP